MSISIATTRSPASAVAAVLTYRLITFWLLLPVGWGLWAAPGAPTGSGAGVATASSGLGQFLVDGAGRTLYLFEADKATSSTCYDACSQAWPPLLTTGSPTAGTGANAAELGTTTRKNGT